MDRLIKYYEGLVERTRRGIAGWEKFDDEGDTSLSLSKSLILKGLRDDLVRFEDRLRIRKEHIGGF